MKLVQPQTWDQGLLRRLHGAPRLRRSRPLLAALVVTLWVVALVPGTAHAHFDVPGTNETQLDFPDESINPFTPQIPPKPVTGRNFVANDRVLIFECPARATDPLDQCLTIGVAATDADGNFSSQVEVLSVFVSPSGTQINCKGWNGGTTQCAVAAATYDTFLEKTTSMADHYICFQGGFCSITRDGTPTTTTTTNLPQRAEWEPVSSMATARLRPAAAAGNDGRIYTMGGHQREADGALSSAEVFDSCRKTWSSLPPMPTARTQFAAAAGPDGRIYAIGGRDSAWGTPLASVNVYDPVTNAWSSVAGLAVPRSDLAAATGSDGRIYAFGGKVGLAPGNDVPNAEAYDPVTNSWAPASPLTSPRAEHGGASGPDGRIYAVAGSSLFSLSQARVESYSPGPAGTPGVWQRSAAQGAPIGGHPAVAAASDGLIYAIGGTTGGGAEAIRSVAIYSPVVDTWTASTEAMTTRRAQHGAAAGRDGRVYAIGGTDDPRAVRDGADPLSSVEALQVAPNNCPPLTEPADFDGDGDTDVSVFRPSNGTWFVKDGQWPAWGTDGDIPVPADYDGDRKTDVAIFRPSTGLWAIHGSGGTDTFVTYGIGSDIPIPADYDGDEKADIAIFRPEYGTWWMHHSSTGLDVPITFGNDGDVPVPGDYDGDSKADLGIFRQGAWFALPSGGGAYTSQAYGNPGDIPVPGDYDADRSTDMAVFRPGEGKWFLHHSSDDTDEVFGFGSPGDIPVVGDYNGDWTWDPAVFRPSTGEWFIETGEAHSWGTTTDIPLPLPYAVREALFA